MQNFIEKLGLGESATSMVLWGGLSVVLLVVVVALAVWLVKTLRPNLNMSGGHGRGGRPQRLAITDAFSLDRDGRKLVIVRRDNIEHLILIGGPNDVLVESNIVRGERSTRDRSGRSGTEAELLQAAETALAAELPRAEAGMPAPAPAPVPAPPAPIVAPPFRSAPSATTARPAPQVNPAPRLDDEFERALVAMQAAQRQQSVQMTQQPRVQPAPAPMPMPPLMPQPSPRPAAPPQMPVQQAATPPSMPAQPMHAQPPMPAQPGPAAPERAARQEPVSEMARRLNEVLQKPLSGTLRPPFNKPIPPVPSTPSMTPKPPPRPVEPAPAASPPPAVIELPPLPAVPPPAQDLPPAQEPPSLQESSAAKQPPPAPKPPDAAGGDSEMDLLEEEMARLLGRPAQSKKPGSP